HTRLQGDWSSDVCSSDLAAQDKYKGQFKLAGLKLSNENYGVGVKKGDSATLNKVNDALTSMVSDGSWQKAVEKNFGPADYKNERSEERRVGKECRSRWTP